MGWRVWLFRPGLCGFHWIPGVGNQVVCQYVQRNSIIPPSKAATNVGKGAFESYGLEDGGEPDVCGSIDTGRTQTLPASGDREFV